MLLDLGADRYDPAAGLAPPETMPVGTAERFRMELERQLSTGNSTSAQRNLYQQYERAREDVRQRFGRDLPNPMDAAPYDTPLDFVNQGAIGQRAARQLTRDAVTQQWRAGIDALRQQFPDATEDELPTPETLQTRAGEHAVEAYRTAERQDRVGGGALGGIAGQVAGALADPVTIGTLPFGAGARVAGSAAWNIGRSALIEGVIAAASQAPIEVVAASYRVSLGLPSDIGQNIVGAALGGAIIGGGARAVSEWLRVPGRAGAPPPPDGGPGGGVLAREDASRILDDQARIGAGNPGLPDAEHAARLSDAVDAVAQGRLPVEAPPVAGRATGPNAGVVYTPAGRAVPVEYQVVELGYLTPSHTDDLTPNPAYPHAEGVQPRDRARDASASQVQAIAGDLQPDRLGRSAEAGTGAPIIDGDGIVESGNGRVLALRRVFDDPNLAAKRAAYLDWLKGQGFDTEGMQQPVLVARRAAALAPDERRAFVREANAETSLTMGAAEQARVDADAVGRIMPLYRGGDVGAAANSEFVRAFMQGLPQAARGRLTAAGGGLSSEGARRLRGAVLARAYGDEMGPLLERVLEADAEGLRNIAGALQDASGAWAAMREAAARGEIAPGMDVTADLLGAVRTVVLARDKRLPVGDLLAQMDLDMPPLGDAGRALLATMFRDPGFRSAAGRDTLGRRLNGFVEEAMKTRPGQDMFGEAAAPASDVLGAVARREAPEPVDPMRGRQAAAAEAGERAAAAQDLPKVPDGELQEARRIAAANDHPIDMGDGPKGARQALDEAEDAVNDATNAAACLIGLAA